MKHTPINKESGFTLVELAIVLVIIGLIIGGVLAGQDLIQSARNQSTAAQIQKFSVGQNTFMGKTGFRPGDIGDARAGAFGLTVGGAGNGNGNGNGFVDGTTMDFNATPSVGEVTDFFDDLSASNLIPGIPTNALPATQWGKGSFAVISRDSTALAPGNLLYFVTLSTVGGVANVAAVTYALGGGTAAAPGAITPSEAFAIDNKLDDGTPATGIVRAPTGTVPTTANFTATVVPGTPATSDCVTGAAPIQYQLVAEVNSCSILVRSDT